MRIGVLNGGGDCPGLNAVLRGVVKSAYQKKIEVYGFYDGYKGLIENHYDVLTPRQIQGILAKGGTVLGTTNRDNPFHYPIKTPEGVIFQDKSDYLITFANALGLDSIVVVGGDGTMAITHELAEKGLKVVGVPKTIDNDLSATDQTFGFETAVNTATDAIDKLHTTAESHHRIMILEVMGRDAGFISLYAGIAGGADVILIPEIEFTVAGILKKVHQRKKRGSYFSIIVVAEGCKIGGEQIINGENKGNNYNKHRLGGIGEVLREQIVEKEDLEVRTTVLGHLQRGGSPAPFDRILSSRYGVAAVEAVIDGKNDVMVCLKNNKIETVPLSKATKVQKTVDPNGELVKTARLLDISFGD
ncbi:MAG: ATP-dependent 6-phosphofructokinase [Clostridiales bacterium]